MKMTLAAIFCLLCLFPSAPLAGEINLSAAASLREAINEIAEAFTKRTPGVKITRNLGGSGALARQIENGAPADIFISANTEWLDFLKGKRLLDERWIGIFAFNELVFVGRPGLKVSAIQDLPGLERIAIGSPRSVPAGEYAMQAMKRAGIDRRMEKRLVMARDVRECLMYAERGEVDGAFVYKSDALQAARNTRILFTVPQGLYPRVTYPMALTTVGGRKGEAAAFYKFLQSPQAGTILERHGFATR
ncbi:MAG: molybdate ABC transporter substrate-binding protein [Deltaproteobacteria bacterium]|nr:molybdate ABC transporter substrate-binding protein [Deltaproteobacteria bacterium]